ncbi:unnamed protein product [Rhizophagus irregularis]|uniref:Uncharacterized protein n=1 Tax=Rhizophagus irregularis TaxID=588596 RepID=A0A2N1N2Z2_9GLOM|nr:hypothetical protein RhiirC2_782511 [Rhizophagus irregularis]CAB4378411.1 unnamed protein product [Rhizophagus irregularis]CAB5371213.1 unnamed protein product [Rhizophagus irregularis]
MSQNPTQNNLPPTQPPNIARQNFNNASQNLMGRTPINNLDGRSVYRQNPYTNMNINHSQAGGLDPTIPQIPDTNTGLQGMLTPNYTAMQQMQQERLAVQRPASLIHLEKSAENINSQAEVPTNNTTLQVRPAINNLNIQSNNQPANNLIAQAGQSVNLNIKTEADTVPNNMTSMENQSVTLNNPQSSQPSMINSIYSSGSAWASRSINPNQFTSDFPKYFKSPADEARNKSIQDKEYEAKHPVPRGIPRKPLDSSKRPAYRPLPKRPVKPQIEKKLVKEFIITGSMINAAKKVNLMRLHRGNNVLDKFQAPVKLHRRDPEAPSSGTGNTRQNEIVIAPTLKTTQQHTGPTTGADTSKIAPFAGARHNKKNLFKKRTTQIYLADDRQRQLKAEERLPWVLEDYDGTNTWVGHFEETDAKYGFLIKDKQDENKLRFLPSHRWYAFRPQIKYKTLTIEEAEEEMARAKKRDNDRWMMRRWGKQNDNEKKIADEEGGIVELKSVMKTVENEEDLFGSDDEGLRRPRRGIESDEEMEFEQVFEDDEEELPDDANPIDEENAEVVKLKKKAIHKPTSLEGEDENEDSFKLTQEGMQLKKLVRKFDDNEAYDDSDQESNPYASEIEESEEELSSESPAITPIIGAAGTKPSPAGKAPTKPKTSTKGKTPAKSTAEKPKGKIATASKIKSTAAKPIKSLSNLSASEEVPVKQKLKGSDIPAAKVPSKSHVKNMTAIPMSSTPEDSTKKLSSKPKSVKSVSPTSSKTSASQSQIALKKQKPATTVRQPVSEMATSFGKKSSAHDSFVSDDDKSIKRTKQSETSTATASINRSANANTVRTSNGGVVKRVREGEDSTSFTGKKVRTDKVSGPQTSTATQGTDSSNSRLILEREVRQIINKNSELTVTTIIKAFRKRIHEDARNKERLLEITKNIAVLKNGYLVLK